MDKVTIRCRKDGPLVIQGEVIVMDHEGNEFVLPMTEKQNIALCRCGHSQHRPFCDGNHRNMGFESCELASEK